MEQNEETRILKIEERFMNLWDNFKHSNIQTIGLLVGEEQEIELLFEQIMRENFPNVVKEIDVQEAQRIPKKLDPRNYTANHIRVTLHKIKGKERILKAARGKERVTSKIFS